MAWPCRSESESVLNISPHVFGALDARAKLGLADAPAECSSTYRHLAKVMARLGWAAVRVRDFNGRGFGEQIRGYVRQSATH
jgi:hypothetical protein